MTTHLDSDDAANQRAERVLSAMFATRLVVALIGLLAGAGIVWGLA